MRKDIYTTNCDCKLRYFETLKQADEHNNDKHNGTCKVFYNSPYGKQIEVSRKKVSKSLAIPNNMMYSDIKR